MIKNSFIKIIALLFFLFFGFTAFGQEKPVAHDNEQDKKYTPNPSSIFNNLNKKRDNSYSSEITIKNVVKFCPTMALRQIVMFYYEREFAKNLTVNVGLGKAFGDDLFQRTFFGIKSFTGESNVLLPFDMLANAKFDRSSPYFYLGGRVYFSSTTFDEGFIELAYRYEKMEYLLNPTINSSRVDGSNRAVFKMSAFSFGYGFTELVGPKNNISHELYLNFGIKLFRYSQFDVVNVQNSSSSTPEYVYQKTGFELRTRILPAINIGYCFGFGF